MNQNENEKEANSRAALCHDLFGLSILICLEVLVHTARTQKWLEPLTEGIHVECAIRGNPERHADYRRNLRCFCRKITKRKDKAVLRVLRMKRRKEVDKRLCIVRSSFSIATLLKSCSRIFSISITIEG